MDLLDCFGVPPRNDREVCHRKPRQRRGDLVLRGILVRDCFAGPVLNEVERAGNDNFLSEIIREQARSYRNRGLVLKHSRSYNFVFR